jgi:hypothetical protein
VGGGLGQGGIGEGGGGGQGDAEWPGGRGGGGGLGGGFGLGGGGRGGDGGGGWGVGGGDGTGGGDGVGDGGGDGVANASVTTGGTWLATLVPVASPSASVVVPASVARIASTTPGALAWITFETRMVASTTTLPAETTSCTSSAETAGSRLARPTRYCVALKSDRSVSIVALCVTTVMYPCCGGAGEGGGGVGGGGLGDGGRSGGGGGEGGGCSLGGEGLGGGGGGGSGAAIIACHGG